MDGAGNIFVADAGNYRIRKLTPIGTNWVSSPIAGGGGPGGPGFKDGTNKVAQFAICYGLCIDAAANIYVADTGNDLIRRISLVGTTNWVVTTVAGQTGQAGYADGTNKNAQFYSPWGIAVDAATNLYVADYGNMSIRKVRPSGTNWIVTTIAGSNSFFGSVDGTNNNARFLYPQGIAIDPAGNLYVSDGGNSTIRRVSPAGTNWVVTTLGGQSRPGAAGEAGAVDGIGNIARFSSPAGLTVGPDGNLYVPDVAENRLVRGIPLFLFDTAVTSFTTPGGSFHFRLTGPPGSNAVVQLSTDLQNWTGVQTNTIPPIGLTTSLPGSNTAGFFRAMLAP